jgi:hypothetical protein
MAEIGERCCTPLVICDKGDEWLGEPVRDIGASVGFEVAYDCPDERPDEAKH